MKFSIIISFLFFASQLLYSQKIDKIIVDSVKIELCKTLYKKDSISYAYIKSNIDTDKTILFLQGSGAIPLFIKEESGSIFFTLPFNVSNFLNKYNFIFISPPGIDIIYKINELSNSFMVVDSLNIPPINYRAKNNLDYLTDRNLSIINKINNKKSSDFYIFGHSQGARIGVNMIIKKPKYFKKIAIASVNPYSRFHGELSKYRLNNILDNVDNSKAINDIYLEYSDLLTNKKPNFEDISYLSFTEPYLIDQLLKINKDILYLYGTSDITTVFEADKIKMEFLRRKKNNIKIKPYLYYNHNFLNINDNSFHWQEVFNNTIDWFEY